METGQFTGRTARAWLRAAAADRDGRSRAATVLWLLLAVGWVVPQAALCADGFAASAYPAAGWSLVAYLLVVACLIVALLLAGLLVARRSGWRWSLAWICAVAAGIALEVKTAGAENSPWAVPSRWTRLELSAGFLAVGAVMAAILVHAPQPREMPGRLGRSRPLPRSHRSASKQLADRQGGVSRGWIAERAVMIVRSTWAELKKLVCPGCGGARPSRAGRGPARAARTGAHARSHIHSLWPRTGILLGA